jgi:hypothetical protein
VGGHRDRDRDKFKLDRVSERDSERDEFIFPKETDIFIQRVHEHSICPEIQRETGTSILSEVDL